MTLERPRTEAPAPDDHPQAAAQADEQAEKKSPALNIPGLLAGAATAATMSVLGGHLSVVGTVLGAALTSIVSGIAVVVYSTSLEKSRRGLKKVKTTVAQRVLARPGLDASESEGSTAVGESGRWGALRPRLKPILISTGAILGLAVTAIFGVQALTGTELSGGTGTIQRSVTGNESVAVRSAPTPAPAEDPAAGTGEVAPADGADPAAEATPAPGAVAPDEAAPTSGAVTGDGTTSGEELPDTGSQQLDSGGTDTGQPGAAAEQGVTGADAGAVPAAP
ncbi:hypothetical protein [Kocuria rhizosphaericola]|uniref:hypothetical protein n=1 Tax=Kocuria rhizosphaericola TaxID=3376284 RepID=UPI003789DFCB